jgi:hypothetical protein
LNEKIVIIIVIIFGVFITLAGLYMTVRPSQFIGRIESLADRVWVYAAAIGVRAVLGLVLIQQAMNSKFPLVIEILGWISLAAAVILAALGHRRFTRFMLWIIEKARPIAPVGGALAALFGAFLVYAFV